MTDVQYIIVPKLRIEVPLNTDSDQWGKVAECSRALTAALGLLGDVEIVVRKAGV